MRKHRFQVLLLSLAVLLTLEGCSGFAARIGRALGGTATVTVELHERLNQDFPLAVDVVIVYERELLDELRNMTAQAWFDQRDQYRKDHEPGSLEAHSREWVPLCADCPEPDPVLIKHRLGVKGAVVFANYFSPGDHRIVIEPLSDFVLRLGESDIEEKK